MYLPCDRSKRFKTEVNLGSVLLSAPIVWLEYKVLTFFSRYLHISSAVEELVISERKGVFQE